MDDRNDSGNGRDFVLKIYFDGAIETVTNVGRIYAKRVFLVGCCLAIAILPEVTLFIFKIS